MTQTRKQVLLKSLEYLQKDIAWLQDQSRNYSGKQTRNSMQELLQSMKNHLDLAQEYIALWFPEMTKEDQEEQQ